MCIVKPTILILEAIGLDSLVYFVFFSISLKCRGEGSHRGACNVGNSTAIKYIPQWFISISPMAAKLMLNFLPGEWQDQCCSNCPKLWWGFAHGVGVSSEEGRTAVPPHSYVNRWGKGWGICLRQWSSPNNWWPNDAQIIERDVRWKDARHARENPTTLLLFLLRIHKLM